MDDKRRYVIRQAESLGRLFAALTQHLWTLGSVPGYRPDDRQRFQKAALAKIRAAKVKTKILGVDLGEMAERAGYTIIEFGSGDDVLSGYFPPGFYMLLPTDAATYILSSAYAERKETLDMLRDPAVVAQTEAALTAFETQRIADGGEPAQFYDPGLPRLGQPDPEAEIVRETLPLAIEPEVLVDE